MQTIARSTFTAVKTEGGLLPADVLQRIAEGRDLDGLRAEDYHLSGERLNEAATRSWNRCLGAWAAFTRQRQMLAEHETGTSLTRERWLLILFQELGYGRLPPARGVEIDGVSYPISHLWQSTPFHLVTFKQDLDRRSEVGTARRRSPHSLMQELLNRSTDYLWGFISNGLRLRILRDNASLSRSAYVEFDLEAIMEGELYADFALLWLVCHQSRVEDLGSSEVGSREIGAEAEAEGDAASGPTAYSPLPTHSYDCWLERWSKAAAEQGTRALDALRDGVRDAIDVLGSGFLAERANADLRRRLQSGELSTQGYYHQVRRLVYRLLFLFVAEDRDLLLLPGTDAATRQTYLDFYSVSQLRRLAESRRGGAHPDLYRRLRLVLCLLRKGYAPLGLPGLNSFLFSADATPDLDEADLSNRNLLQAIFALAFTVENGVRRPVDYRNLDTEELGSVYESLLELHPRLDLAASTFTLEAVSGSERKTTGSYYTPTALVNELLDSALEPVVARRLARARRMREVGSREIGSRGREHQESRAYREKGEGHHGRDQVVSGPEGVASGHGRGRNVLPGDTGMAAGRGVRSDQPGATGRDLDSSQHRGGVWPGGTQGVPSVSAHRPGVSEGTGDASAIGGTRRPGGERDGDAAAGPMRGVGQDAPHTDPQAGGAPLAAAPTPHSLLPTSLSAYPPLERAILSIKVLDCATGSGHMLIGAARRLAHHLAVIRTGDDEPGPDHVRHALRDVVRHCIYGVDVNDMAVELCKVALWMETLEPGKPLGFLDAHIRHGNSLVGVTSTDDLAEGIPDDAYSAKTGDDKAAAREIKRRNKKERTSLQHTLFEGHPEDDLLAEWHAFLAAPEETPQQIADKDALYAELRRPGGPWDRLQTACHLWTAAFFAEYTGDKRTDERIATTADLRAYLAAPESANEEQIAYARDLAKRHAFFHWSLEFPDVYRQGGFDVILSNPPWEQIQVDAREFFAARAPAIAQAPTMAVRNRMIKELQKSDPHLYAAFQSAAHENDSVKQFVHDSKRFPYTSYGRLNLAPLFAELSAQLVSGTGRVGIIVPTGIATDSFNQYFFNYLVDSRILVSLYDFENRRRIFPAVDSRIKFCLMTLTGNQHPAEAAEFVFFAQDVADLREEDRRFTLSAEEIALLNPNTRTCPIFRSKRDAELTKAIYRRVPVLVKEGTPEENPWGINFLRMFDMSNDSHLFRTRQQLEADGWRLEGNVFVKKGVGSGEIGSRAERYLPLYEGKLVWHFDHRFSTFINDADTESVDTRQHLDPTYVVYPRYWVPLKEVRARTSDRWFIGFRDISNSTNERTAIWCVIPESGVSNKFPVLVDSPLPSHYLAIFAAGFQQFVFDFAVRQKMGGTSLNFFIVKQLPVLPPETYDQPCPWAGAPAASAPTAYLPTAHSPSPSLSAWILPRVLELTYTAWDLEPFARDVMREIGNGERRGDTGDDASASAPYSPLPPFRWDEERRFLLRCELDAAYFHLYGIARDDVAYILETFPIVKRKDMAAYGEYRTQRVILEIYDEMAEAMAGGAPYQTRLDPPPADPRVAHPPKAR